MTPPRRLVIRQERQGYCSVCGRKMKVEHTFVLHSDETLHELEQRAYTWAPEFAHRRCRERQGVDGQMSLFGEGEVQ